MSHITLINKLFITIANILKGEINDKTAKHRFYSFGTAEPHPILYKYSENLRNNGRMRVKFDKWLVHIPFLCYLTILLNLAEGAVYGGY